MSTKLDDPRQLQRALQILMALRSSSAAGLSVAELADACAAPPITIRRSLSALRQVGAPVESRRGRGGGWTLAPSLFSALTRMSEAAARSELRRALQASTPSAFRAARGKRGSQGGWRPGGAQSGPCAVDFDPVDWHGSPSGGELLQILSAAIVQHAELSFSTAAGGAVKARPRRLIWRAGEFYLAADVDERVEFFRTENLRQVKRTGPRFSSAKLEPVEAAWERLAVHATVKVRAVLVVLRFGDAALPRIFPGEPNLGAVMEELRRAPRERIEDGDRVGWWRTSFETTDLERLAFAIEHLDRTGIIEVVEPVELARRIDALRRTRA